MIICHIITTIERGGAENQLVTLVKAQASQGHEVFVFFLKGAPENFKRLSLNARFVGRLTMKKLLLGILFGRAKFGFDSKFDIIHAHLPRAELLGSMIASRIQSRFVVTKHNSERFIKGAPLLISNLIFRIVSKRVSCVILISESVRNYLLQIGEIKENDAQEVIYYGVEERLKDKDLKENYGNRGYKNVNKPVRCVMLARLVKQKNIPYAIDMCRFLPQNYTLDIFGAGPLRSSINVLIKDHLLENRIRIRERTLEVEKILKESDVLLLSSNYEGFGLVLLEGMSSGTRIVAPDIPACREVLGSDYPFLLDLSDPLNGAITLMSAVQTKKEIFQQTWEKRLDIFTVETMAKRVEEVYLKVI